MIQLVLLIFFISFPIISYSTEEKPWKPEPHFTVEGRSIKETITFLSGISYGLSWSKITLYKQNKENFFCKKDGISFIGLKLLIDIVNADGRKSISSAEVNNIIIRELLMRFPCENKNGKNL